MDSNQITNVHEERAASSAQATLFRNVYLWMALALCITAITSLIVASSESILNTLYGSSSYLFYGLLIAEFALVWFISARIDKLSFTNATIGFVIYSILNGVTLSVIFLLYTSSSIASTFFVTAATFGAMAVFGTVTKKDLSSMGSILIMALIGLIIASVVNIFLNNPMMYWIITYAGVLIFVGLTAYDAQKIKRRIEAHGSEINDTTQKIALMGALSLYLDFINLFLYLLRILGSRR